MQFTTILIALFEFFLTAALSIVVIYVNYRLFIYTNRDYDAEEEMIKDNVGVAILLSSLLVAAGLIVKEGIYPVVNLVRLYYMAPMHDLSGARLAVLVLCHLALVFLVAVLTISVSLRFWGRLTRNVRKGEQLKRGNTAVGIVLAGVVLVMAMFMSDAISRVTKSLIPQPSIGRVEIAR